MKRSTLLLLTSLALLPHLAKAAPPTNKEAEQKFFEEKIRPLLYERCIGCHGDKQASSGLRLDSRANILKGGSRGSAMIPGDTVKSLLLQAVRQEGALKMPPTGKLSPYDLNILTQWIEQGAVWEETKQSPADALANKKNFWSFRPIKRATPPTVKNSAWVKNPIDAFILARLEAKGISPAKMAERRALLRRATFDLTGLPPTPQEVDAFVADRSPNAFAKVVDRLLASPHYGERWGRHWLDVMRYADSLDARGIGSEGDIAEAFRYRDWVVNAMNQDMPYNQFILNQIAGDLLPTNPPGDVNVDGTIATGVLAIGNWGNGDADKEKIITDIADDQLDVVSRGIMGVTLACARCHDHKFDPFTTKDYYGIAGIFFSTHILPKLTPKGAGETPLHIPLLTRAEKELRTTSQAKLGELEKRIAQERRTAYEAFAQSLRKETAKYLTTAWRYRHRGNGDAGLTVEAFAKQESLQPFAVRQWLSLLGTGTGYTAMGTRLQNVLGNAGIYGWRGATDTPSMVVNTTKETHQLLTFTLPPHSISLHPSPSAGVAVEWQSPYQGAVRIRGKVVDADPACGDGIAWEVVQQGDLGRNLLAKGGFENGGQDTIGKAPLLATVRPGDRLQLAILPKQNHGCDTTTVEFEVASEDGSKVWNITKDTLAHFATPTQQNPMPDSYGNPGVWQFSDMAGGAEAIAIPAEVQPAWRAWQDAVRQAKENLEQVQRASERFQQQAQWTGMTSPFYPHRADDETALPPATQTALREMAMEIEALKKTVARPVMTANGAQDGGLPETQYAGFHDVRVHRRGNYTLLGDLVPRGFPTILALDTTPLKIQGSGRLQLAEWLTDPRHPLTARVLVNRLWQHHFGEGIVRTPNNFGLLGERPSHPELLDWLASELIRQKWSLKQMHRLILLSSTYQQSSVASPVALSKDVDNRLFSRMPRRRLESEAIRDSLLMVSGKLDTRMGGVADRDIRTPRRTLYIMTVRSERSGFGPLFDVADSTAVVEKRITSTVAPQALFLLNSPLVMEQTTALVERLMKESSNLNTRGRLNWLYRTLYGREASEVELQIGERYLSQAQNSNRNLSSAWNEYIQLLLCANEFLYVD